MIILDEPPVASPRVKRWTKREYNAMVDRGAFQGQRLFLYRGELIDMPPMGALHARSLSNITEWLVRTFTPDYRIRNQSPFQAPGDTVPEPDGAVYTHEQFKWLPHPRAAVLLIEVADSSLDLDHEKGFDYAAASVPEYWIVDVIGRVVEVYRYPVADAAAPLGFRYQSHQLHHEGETISSLARPDSIVAVAVLLGR